MMQGSAIDIAISPAQTVIGELLMHLRRGDVAAVHSLRRGAAEALEGVARGDAKTSKLVGRRIEQIKVPKGSAIGAGDANHRHRLAGVAQRMAGDHPGARAQLGHGQIGRGRPSRSP